MLADPTPSASYRSGDWLAAAGSGVWLLLRCNADDDLVSTVWAALARQGSAEEVQSLLCDSRQYGLVSVGSGATLVVLAGSATAEVSLPGVTRTLECPPGVTVAQYQLGGAPEQVSVLGGALADESNFPLGSGVARAGALYLDWTAVSMPASPLVADPDPGPPPVAAVVAVPAVNLDPPPAAPADIFDSSLTLDPRTALDSGLTLPSLPELEQPPEPETAAVADDSYSYLFGKTINRSVEDAAVRPLEPVISEAPPPELPPEPVPVPTEDAPATAVEALPPPPIASPSPMIDAVPLGGPSVTHQSEVVPPAAPAPKAFFVPSPGAAPSPPVASEPDLEMTVNRVAHAAALRQMEAPAGPGAPTVHAVRCSTNHPNPPHAGSCRVCAAPIPDQSPITVPRPVLGRLKLSTGDQVVLDRGVLVGRGPSEGRLVGGERPHLVKLPSPDHDISRNHVEVRLDGWHVLVTDLNSTNGTLITRPGMEPERLRPDQPTMIEPGTVVNLSDDLSLTYEVSA